MPRTDPPSGPAGDCPGSRTLRDFLVGRLPHAAHESVARHLDHCTTCLAALPALDDGDDELVRIFKSDDANEGRPAAATRAGSPRPEESNGERFHILQGRDEGGVGVISVARDGELPRDVAIKEIRPPYCDDPRSRERFLREAEITGMLEHPGIVPIYSLGRHRDGRPYYAMRLVDGQSLQAAIAELHGSGRPIDHRSLALRQLLGRLVDACNAVAYAHSRGIIHRDLKPGNILLGPFGETLVIDWGLATRLGRRGEPCESEDPATPGPGAPGHRTLPGSTIGTASYMSPEQAERRFDELGLAADVYSLGATLYSVLTGALPFPEPSGKGSDLEAVLERVRQGDFPPPRARNPGVPRALEAIALKAMARRPENRYPSPTDLARDIENWMADEPVSALKERWYQRRARWLRQHRGVAAMGTAALAVIALGAIVAGVMLDLARTRETRALARAERRMDLALKAIGQFRKAVATNLDVQLRPDLKGLRRQLLGGPRDFFEQLREDLQSSEETGIAERTRLAQAAFELALTSTEVGSPPDAIAAYEQGIAVMDALVHDEPEVADHSILLARALGELAMVQRAIGRDTQAAANLQRSLAIQESLAREAGTADRRADLAGTIDRLGLFFSASDPERAREHFEHAIILQRDLARQEPGSALRKAALAQTYNHLGMLHKTRRRPDDARKNYEQSVEILEGLVREHPEEPRYRHALAATHHNLGNMNLTPGRSEPRKNYQRACELLESLIREYPSVLLYRSELVRSLGNHAVTQRFQHPEESWASFERMRDIQEGIVRESPEVPAYRRDLALTYINLAAMRSDRGDLDGATADYRKARNLLDVLLDEMPDTPDIRRAWGVSCVGLGDTLANLRPSEAIAAYHEAIRGISQVVNPGAAPRDHPFRDLLVTGHLGVARAHRDLGQLDEAVDTLGTLRPYCVGTPGEMYEIAAELATCASPAGLGLKTRAGPADASLEGLADRAIDALRDSIRSGFRDLERLRADPAFRPFALRDDLRELLDDLAFPTDPFVGN